MRGYENILKTLNTDNQLSPIETTYKFKAAQPCSYIYPIYSVVKNRLRQRLVAATRYWSALETSSRISVRYFVVAGDSTSSWLASMAFRENGGADRDRTDDILLAKQALSQLSYSPV